MTICHKIFARNYFRRLGTAVFILVCLGAGLTASAVLAQVAVSDDFSGPSLATPPWTFVDPVGDSSVLQANGVVTLAVPAGSNHDLWTLGNETARIMQVVTDSDLQVEAKFESMPSEAYQITGLLFEESPGNYTRVDFFHDGSVLHMFAASFVADVPNVHSNLTVPAASLGWLRVDRTGNTFTVEYSFDGVTWMPGPIFNKTMTLTEVGVFAGNAGSPAPAFTSVVDYFFDTADPIDPEDGGLVDIWPPVVSDILVVPDVGTGSAMVTCTTSEPATTLVSYGLDALYGTDVAGTSGDGLTHQILLTGLVTGIDYHFSITATDTLANADSTPDQQFTFDDIIPEITVWHGSDQRVGHLGMAQADFNLMGTVTPWEDLASLGYSLNEGTEQPLNWGAHPDGDYGDERRLANNGDFNVDLPISQLLPGVNTITVLSMDIHGKADTVVTNVTLETGSTPFPVAIDWDTVTDPQDVGQYIDGQWGLEGDGLRTKRIGYDRLFMIGDEDWQDYEIVTPLTIHGLEEPGPRSGNAGMGFLMRFTGHVVGGHRNFPDAQPKWGYQPFGGLGWLRWLSGIDNNPTVQFYHGDYDVAENFGGAKAVYGPQLKSAENVAEMPFGDPSMATDFGLANIRIGETFWMKMRCQTLPNAPNGDGVTLYSFKVWQDTEAEPLDWNFQVSQQSEYALRQGGVLLLAHHVDVTFGDVSVIDISGILPNTPPVAQDDQLNVALGLSGDVNVLANDSDIDGALEPATVTIVDTPLNGTISGIDPVTGVVTYLHDGGVAVADSFTYTVEDNSGDVSNTATVRVAVSLEPLPNLVTDDFNSCDVDPVWTFVNPQGDSPPPVITGPFSGDAQVAISVPGGGSHEPYDGYLGMPYILQDAEDQDFTAEVKFSSTLPDSAYALQGMLVRQDDATWLRFDFYSNGAGGIMLYASTQDGGGAQVNTQVGNPGDSPLYMRVQRTGNQWDLDWSADGGSWNDATSFTYTMMVTGVGLYAGNSGGSNAPDFTTFIDYFANVGDEPFTEPDDQETNTLTVALVGSGSVAPSPDLAVYTCNDLVQLDATPDAGWIFTGWSGDLTGTDNPAFLTMNRAKYVTATFEPSTNAVIAASTAGVIGLSDVMPCAAGVPIGITRNDATDIRGFTLTIELINLDLCSGVGSIVEGDFLNSISPTSFNVTDNLDGTYLVDATILGEPCGATALTGTLLTLDVTHTIADGTGSIAVSGLELRDCTNTPLLAQAGPDADILIDNTAPDPVAGLVPTLAMTGNPPGNTGTVNLAWTPSGSPDVSEVVLYRKGFGAYPEFDDAGGTAPTLPTDPVGEGWDLVATVPVGTNAASDLHGVRDYWYYCARTTDLVGNASIAVLSGGTLNYLLGDVSDGGSPIADGNNEVWVEDLTLLGAHYGTSDREGLYLDTLDIGPTSDTTILGRPLTDDTIDFEDLILFGINYGTDLTSPGGSQAISGVPAASGSNLMALHLPDLPAVGQTFEAELVLAADGQIQGLGVPLTWDPAVVTPVSYQPGPLMAAQGGSSAVLSPAPGVVDAVLAGVRNTGISGVGTLATVTFEVLAAGDPGIQLGVIDARDATNQPVVVPTTAASAVDSGGVLPAVSALLPNYPNPFNPMTTIAFDLASSGRVRIDVFSIDGRRVRTLVDQDFGPGRHTAVFDGKDQTGRQVASGTYLYVMQGPGINQTRRMLLVK